MKKLKFRYHLKIEFDQLVTQHSFTLRCFLETDERQQILQLNKRILPKESLGQGRDSFGNSYMYGKAVKPHSLFEALCEGTVYTGLKNSVAAKEDWQLHMYAVQTNYTRPGAGLNLFFENLQIPDTQSSLEKSLYLMEALRAQFSYVQGQTDISPTAESAWQQGCGVCQDYAHILLSLCRMAGIRCRYVAGMLIGEGASHAWIEVEDNGCWYGLDPTNGAEVREDHIKLSHGRDYGDCLLNQGVFTGNARQQSFVSVSVEEETDG